MSEQIKRQINKYLKLASQPVLTRSEELYGASFLFKEGMSDCDILNAGMKIALKRLEAGLCETIEEDVFQKIAESLNGCTINDFDISSKKDCFMFGVTVRGSHFEL